MSVSFPLPEILLILCPLSPHLNSLLYHESLECLTKKFQLQGCLNGSVKRLPLV